MIWKWEGECFLLKKFTLRLRLLKIALSSNNVKNCKWYKMIYSDGVSKENIKINNPNWPLIPDHP